jgi:hypothetical protein
VSGPWDRPSPQNPDDREPSWPAEDIESPSQQSPAEPWSPDDPWQERRDSSGWDAWPPADDVTYQPELPSSDPWAESWADDDAPAASSEPAYEPTPARETASAAPAADERRAFQPTAYEPPAYEPPAGEPVASDAEPAVAAPAEVEEPAFQPTEPELENVPPAPFGYAAEPPASIVETAPPRIEPWSPDADPWGMSTDSWPPVAVEEPIAQPEPVATEPAESTPIVEEPTVDEPIVKEPIAPGGSPAAETAAVGDLEALTSPDDEVTAQPAEMTAEPAATAAEPAGATEPAVPEEAEAIAPAKPTVEESGPDSTAPAPIFGTVAAAQAAEPATTDEAAPPAEPAPAEAGPAPEPVVVEAEAADTGSADEPATVETEAADAGATDEPEDDHLGEAGLAALAAAVAATKPADEPPTPQPEETHEPPWAAALWGEEAPPSPAQQVEAPAPSVTTPAGEPLDEVWPPEPDHDGVPPVGDHTQVFPSDWAPAASAHERAGELDPEAGTVRTSLTDPDLATEAPSTAEQAVPWLIGLILLLAGMVIVLLALIFAGDASLGGAAAGPSGTADPSPSLMVGSLASPSADPSGSAPPSAAATATPVPVPQYGPLEMVYQGRAAALAPIYLLRRDFTIDEDPAVLAQDANLDVHVHAWSPDGKVGAGLLSDVLVSIEPGKEKRRLGDGIATLTFGDDASTVYAVRVTEDGGNDVASVLAIDFANGDTDELASVSYKRPDVPEEAALKEAQLLDDGGSVRIFWMDDDTLLLWSQGGGAWSIDPAGGEATELAGDLPLLWSADGHHHIAVSDKDGTSTLTLSNGAGAELATATIKGLVSHLRWSPDGARVVFTAGHSTSGGGVLQDLYLWDLGDGDAPMQLTSTGAAFGAEWLGTTPRWAAG